MIWQDILLTSGSAVFLVALIPTILGTHKPERSTAAATTVTLFAFVGIYCSLHLWLTAVMTFGTATAWAIILAQTCRTPSQRSRQNR